MHFAQEWCFFFSFSFNVYSERTHPDR